MIQIAIIDTYVKTTKESTTNNKIFHYKIKKGKVVRDNKKYIGRKIVNHGSICFAILYENTKDISYTLHCIKVIDNGESKGSIHNLIIALEWCLENNIQIISMSVGSRKSEDGRLLEGIINKLYAKGVILVAAFNNNNNLTYPAFFDAVIGVTFDNSGIVPINSYIYCYNNNQNIDIIARCDFTNLEKKLGIQIGKYNSFAVPYIVSVIMRILQDNVSLTGKNIRLYLKKYASTISNKR